VAGRVYIFCIETSHAVTSVAISLNGECIASRHINEGNKAADTIHLLTREVLEEAGIQFQDLNAIAISSGPGSYTGLRIAVSAAKGLCFGLEIPLIAVPTFEAMVEGVLKRYNQVGFDLYMPMIDARRMEVFTAVLTADLNEVLKTPSLVLDETFEKNLIQSKKYMFFGNGALKAAPFIKNGIIFEEYLPHAMDLCNLAFIRNNRKQFEDLYYFEPNYSKSFYQA